MSKHVISPNALRLAGLVEGIWHRILPKGAAVNCPTLYTLALSIDALRFYGLIDNDQESKVVEVIKRHEKKDMVAQEYIDELDEVSQHSAEKLMASVAFDIDEVIKKTDFEGQAVPWEPPPMPFTEEEEADAAPIMYKTFMSAQAYLASVADETNAGPNRGRYMQRLIGLSQKKRCVKVEHMTAFSVAELAIEMPNFSEVLADISVQINARKRLGLSIKLQPILLLGKPGIGKTRFIKDLASALFCESHVFNMGGHGDVLKLKGLSKGWGSSRPGDIATKLALGATFNPLLMLDEIDKARSAGGDRGHDIASLLLAYLEPESSGEIEDDYIGSAMDLSGVNWIFAANSIDDLPDFFMSRVDVYHIPDFTMKQKRDVIKNIFEELSRNEFNDVVKSIGLDVIDKLATLNSAREIRRALFHAIAAAVADSRVDVLVDDLRRVEVAPQRQSIGFM